MFMNDTAYYAKNQGQFVLFGLIGSCLLSYISEYSITIDCRHIHSHAREKRKKHLPFYCFISLHVIYRNKILLSAYVFLASLTSKASLPNALIIKIKEDFRFFGG